MRESTKDAKFNTFCRDDLMRNKKKHKGDALDV